MKRELHEWFKQQKMQKAQSKAKARGSVAVNTQIHLGCLRQARTQSNFDPHPPTQGKDHNERQVQSHAKEHGLRKEER